MTTTISIIDVGHGNAAVIRDSDAAIVIDCGPKVDLFEFLKREKIFQVEHVLLSHSDADHIGGLINLVASEEVEVGSVFVNTDSSKTSALWDDLVFTIAKSSTQLVPSLTTESYGSQEFGRFCIEVSAPSSYLAAKGPGSTDRKGRLINSNSMSAVIRVLFDGDPVILFAGDIDAVGLSNLLEWQGQIEAPILVFPHHGGHSGTSSSEGFAELICATVDPRRVIFSIGREKHKNPLPEVVQKVLESRAGTYIACTQLSRNCSAVNLTHLPEYANKYHGHGIERKNSCSGTITITLPELEIHPPNVDHQAFIVSSVPGAMCKFLHK